MDALIVQLEDALTDFSDTLARHHQYREGPRKQNLILISRQELKETFVCILSGLKKVTHASPEMTTDEIIQVLEPEIACFREIALKQRLRCSGVKEVFEWFKFIWHLFEDCIRDLTANSNSILNLLEAHRYLVDLVELEICSCLDTNDVNSIISESAETKKRLDQEKTTYKSIFETTSNQVLIADGAGRIIEANPEANMFFHGQNITGRFCWDVLGLPCSNLKELLEHVPLDVMREITISALDTSRVFNLQVKPLSQVFPIAEGILLILSDITYIADHRQTLEYRVLERTRALTRSEKIVDTIFQSVGKGILLLDSDLEIFKANQMASEMYGIPLEILVGTPYRSLVDEKGMQEMSEICATLTDGELRSIECLSTYVDGRVFPSMLTVASVSLEGRSFWPIIAWDITEQKELENKLVSQKFRAEEMNVTLRNVLATIENQKKEFEQNISNRIRSSILPGIAKVRAEKDENVRASYLALVKEQLISLTSGFEDSLDGDLLKLSKTELRICQFIKAGLAGKEICETMNLAFETVQTHRKNIRKKLGLRGKDVNLYSFLVKRNFDA